MKEMLKILCEKSQSVILWEIIEFKIGEECRQLLEK